MKNKTDSIFQVFNRDVAENAGYRYTATTQLSCQLANRRQSDAALAAVEFRGKRVIDIGCGDGTYTVELFDRGQPAHICGVDPAEKAIEVARQKVGGRTITFDVHSAYELPYPMNSFDIAHIRGVLHHLDRPVEALRQAIRVAPLLVIIEPNGYSPALKLLERFSTYHREHGEKSYAPFILRRWVRDLQCETRSRRWVGLVPFFCPDWIARTLKFIEPFVEATPLIRACSLATYVIVAARRQ